MADDRGLAPICFTCKHYQGISPGVGYICEAFGKDTSIPIEIIVSSADHHEPFEGDNGVQYSPMEPRLANDPPESEAQRRLMFAAANKKGGVGGVPQSVGKEFANADPGGKLPQKARDMSGNDWKVLRWLLNKFFAEESQEPEHREPGNDGIILDECVQQIRNLMGEFRKSRTARDVRNPTGELSETEREKIGRAGGFKREDMPEDVFLKPEDRTYPVKEKKDGSWRYDRDLLLAAARRARMNHEEHIANKADEIRNREFSGANDGYCDPDRRVYGKYPEYRDLNFSKDASFEEIRNAVESKASDPDALAAWIKDKVDPGWRSERAQDRALAHDESPWTPKLAADKEPTRTTDAAGHMHVKDTVLTKAVVSPYLGEEINGVMKDEPGWETLEPQKTYHLLRDPKELKKALDTFNGKPLLWVHRGVDANDHPSNLVIGSTGSNAHLGDNDELTNDLVIWPKYATEAVEDGEKKSLSCGYGYKADMTPGEYKGHHYDGIMRDISGNHVALVDKPRVPGAKVGGDSMPDDVWGHIAEALLAA